MRPITSCPARPSHSVGVGLDLDALAASWGWSRPPRGRRVGTTTRSSPTLRNPPPSLMASVVHQCRLLHRHGAGGWPHRLRAEPQVEATGPGSSSARRSSAGIRSAYLRTDLQPRRRGRHGSGRGRGPSVRAVRRRSTSALCGWIPPNAAVVRWAAIWWGCHDAMWTRAGGRMLGNE
jgi:hypothetical protein